MIDKLKLIVEEQFPEFYREEYPIFVEFLKQYYAYLETTNVGKVESYKDIDNSVDAFILQLKNDFAKNVPQFGNLSDREFLLFAKEFYSARGSEDSYRFLFRAMFGKEVELFYPSTVVFRASDGRWEQDVVIRVDVTNGDTISIADKVITITDVAGRSLPVYVPKVRLLNGTTWEVYIDRLFTGAITSGDTVSFGDFAGTVVNGAASLDVVVPGTGYSVGNYFNVEVSGQLLRFRVARINADTSIHKVEIIQAGANYVSPVYAKIEPGVRDAITDNQVTIGNQALIRINPGAILKYPGFFATANGFPSDVMYLQDSKYYQAYSYVIKLDEKLEEYKDIVMRLLHPSGMALWGQYNVSTDIALNISVENTLRNLIAMVQDEVFWADVLTKIINKSLTDTFTQTEVVTFESTKNLSDVSPVLDSGSVSIQVGQDYGDPSYFLETGLNQYAQGSGSLIRTW